MNFDAADFARARVPLILLGALCIAIAVAGFRLHDAVVAATRAFDTAVLRQRGIDYRRQQLEAGAADLQRHLDFYRRLAASGRIGPERRSAWIEHLARSKAQRQLPDLRYELAPRRPVDAGLLPEGPGNGRHEFTASSMHLHLRLVHEEDLADLLSDLGTVADALPVVRGCLVERLDASSSRIDGARLKAECAIDWITIAERPL